MELPLPVLDRTFIKVVYSLVSYRKPNKNATEELWDFYNHHYLPPQPEKIYGIGLKEALDQEITDIITNIKTILKIVYIITLVHYQNVIPKPKKMKEKLEEKLKIKLENSGVYCGVMNSPLNILTSIQNWNYGVTKYNLLGKTCTMIHSVYFHCS